MRRGQPITLPMPPTQCTADIAQKLFLARFGDLKDHIHHHVTKDSYSCSGTFENIGLHCEASTQEEAYYSLCDGLIRLFSNKPIITERNPKWQADHARLT